jgi:hypothetical protein
MKKKKDRDIEKVYTVKQMVDKLRRLADCLEYEKSFGFRSLVKESIFRPLRYLILNMNARVNLERSSFSLNGCVISTFCYSNNQ